MQSILDRLLAVDAQAQETTEGDATCLECTPTVPDLEFTSKFCSNDGCRRKRTTDCITGMCFPCCYDTKKACAAHYRLRKKREEEDRYIEAGLRSARGQKTTFYHYEEKFMKCDQTVVIWCLEDFLRRKEWSADTMAQFRREQRTQELLRRRHALNAELQSHSSSSSLNAITSTIATTTSSTPSKQNGHAATNGKAAIHSPAVVDKAGEAGVGAKKRGRGKASTIITSPSPTTHNGHSSAGTNTVKNGASAAQQKKTTTSASSIASVVKLTKAQRKFQKVKERWVKEYKLKPLAL